LASSGEVLQRLIRALASINRQIKDLHRSSERLQQAIREADEVPAGIVTRPVILVAAKA